MHTSSEWSSRTPYNPLPWTKREDKCLRAFYPDYKTLQKRLNYRSLGSIQRRCGRLNILNGRRDWSAAEVLRLRKIWPRGTKREIYEQFPFRSYKAVQSKASKLRIGKLIQYKISGIEQIDEVRRRARLRGYTMVELDLMCKSGNYFSVNYKNAKKANPVYIQTAVKRLGGKLKIEWLD